jgi:myo-inositol-1(or 4)-monophosphatase
MKLWEQESELALRAVSQAGERSLDRPDQLAFSLKGHHKDIVTEMDILLQKQIFSILAESKYSVFGEEQAEHQVATLNEPNWWVDPLDGTTNYANKIPFYAISAGLVRSSDFLVGAVAAPAQRELYFTFGSEQSFLNGKKLKLNGADLKSAVIAASFSGQKDANKPAEYKIFEELNEKSRGVLRTGSATLNICYVACDRLQAAYGFANRIWDIAGAVAIARAAGAEIYVDFINQTTCRYLVAVPGVFGPLLTLFKERGLF